VYKKVTKQPKVADYSININNYYFDTKVDPRGKYNQIKLNLTCFCIASFGKEEYENYPFMLNQSYNPELKNLNLETVEKIVLQKFLTQK
jgi:hypothetical protein